MKSANNGEWTRLIVPLRRRLDRAVWLQHVIKPTGLLLVLCGAALLILKLFLPEFHSRSFAVLGFVPVAFLAVWITCRKKQRFFSDSNVAEVIDHLYLDDGSVTSVYERPGLRPQEDFLDVVQQELRTKMPRIDPVYHLRRLLLPGLFLGIAAVIPPRAPAVQRQQQEMLEVITKPLLEKLQENSLLPEEQKKELIKDLEEIRQTDQGVSREQWEAVEEMEQRVENAVKENDARAEQVATALNQLSEMSDHSGDSSNMGGSPDSQAKMDKLVQDLAIQANDMKMPLNSNQRSALSKSMSQLKGGKPMNADCKATLDSLRKELESLGEGKKSGRDGDGLGYGRGGVDRGRGDAPLVFGEEKNVEAVSDEKMVQNQFLSPDDLVDLGVVPIQPKPEPGRFSPGTLKSYGEQQGTQVSRTEISPSQKNVVSRYFGK